MKLPKNESINAIYGVDFYGFIIFITSLLCLTFFMVSFLVFRIDFVYSIVGSMLISLFVLLGAIFQLARSQLSEIWVKQNENL